MPNFKVLAAIVTAPGVRQTHMKNIKNQGAITLQKMNFWKNLKKIFFHFLNINPDARSDSSIIFRFSIILHQNYREYTVSAKKKLH